MILKHIEIDIITTDTYKCLLKKMKTAFHWSVRADIYEILLYINKCPKHIISILLDRLSPWIFLHPIQKKY